MANLNKLARLIELSRGSGVNFGTSENSPSLEWIQKAEAKLGRALPPTYKWFLSNYGGGDVRGDEVFSIYEMEFEAVFGGDIVFQYLSHQRSRTLEADQIPLSQTDHGEVFYFRASAPNSDNEYPVFVKRGGHHELYALTFADFLKRRVEELCSP